MWLLIVIFLSNPNVRPHDFERSENIMEAVVGRPGLVPFRLDFWPATVRQ
jgi:hypothetical protein